ncbi:hypothetical protein [Allobranchiibius huperziae]|uniref:Uncharacterized protein n=1 Tax=Allobranchiibius huperziae TaxID=1874116 RepID=A0A853D8B4_9MICO|nr:hypothetical protein [Allobranchiibius huperziae]NYJ73412.1 hypothetical protein [Allobranchiibius huperziae]
MPRQEDETRLLPVNLPVRQRWAIGSLGGVSFALGAVSNLWAGQDGVSTLGFVVVGAGALIIGTVGKLPTRVTWGDKSVEMGALYRAVASMDHDQRLALAHSVRESGEDVPGPIQLAISGVRMAELALLDAVRRAARGLHLEVKEVGADLPYNCEVYDDARRVGVILKAGGATVQLSRLAKIDDIRRWLVVSEAVSSAVVAHTAAEAGDRNEIIRTWADQNDLVNAFNYYFSDTVEPHLGVARF